MPNPDSQLPPVHFRRICPDADREDGCGIQRDGQGLYLQHPPECPVVLPGEPLGTDVYFQGLTGDMEVSPSPVPLSRRVDQRCGFGAEPANGTTKGYIPLCSRVAGGCAIRLELREGTVYTRELGPRNCRGQMLLAGLLPVRPRVRIPCLYDLPLERHLKSVPLPLDDPS